MNLNLNELEAAVGKMTPGPWEARRRDRLGTAIENRPKDRPTHWRHVGESTLEADAAGIVALRNAAPELIKAARERDELAALLRRLRENHPDSRHGVSQMASGEESQALWAEVDAALAKVGTQT